jgi:hypothetical protein
MASLTSDMSRSRSKLFEAAESKAICNPLARQSLILARHDVRCREPLPGSNLGRKLKDLVAGILLSQRTFMARCSITAKTRDKGLCRSVYQLQWSRSAPSSPMQAFVAKREHSRLNLAKAAHGRCPRPD